MHNVKSKWWLITWNNYPSNWQFFLINGYDKLTKLHERDDNNNLAKLNIKIKKLVAVCEIAPITKIKHLHCVINFDTFIYKSQMRSYYNNDAHCKALKYDKYDNGTGYDNAINYLFKQSPTIDNILTYPNVISWNKVKIIRKFYEL